MVEGQLAQSLELYSPGATIVALFRKFPQGTKDKVWVPQIAAEPGWIAISMDRGEHSIISERLPLICQAFYVTHVTLSRGLAKRSMYFRATAIEACWPALFAAAEEPPGTGFRLSMRDPTIGVSFSLKKITDALLPRDAPPVQKTLPLDL